MERARMTAKSLLKRSVRLRVANEARGDCSANHGRLARKYQQVTAARQGEDGSASSTPRLPTVARGRQACSYWRRDQRRRPWQHKPLSRSRSRTPAQAAFTADINGAAKGARNAFASLSGHVEPRRSRANAALGGSNL
jgi:hypothetical protein